MIDPKIYVSAEGEIYNFPDAKVPLVEMAKPLDPLRPMILAELLGVIAPPFESTLFEWADISKPLAAGIAKLLEEKAFLKGKCDWQEHEIKRLRLKILAIHDEERETKTPPE